MSDCGCKPVGNVAIDSVDSTQCRCPELEAQLQARKDELVALLRAPETHELTVLRLYLRCGHTHHRECRTLTDAMQNLLTPKPEES